MAHGRLEQSTKEKGSARAAKWCGVGGGGRTPPTMAPPNLRTVSVFLENKKKHASATPSAALIMVSRTHVAVYAPFAAIFDTDGYCA